MGEVIRKDAAAADVFADAGTTLSNARARGGEWQALAEARLTGLLTVAASVDTKATAAQVELQPLASHVDVADLAADDVLVRARETLWNALGRPGHDPLLDLLFPGGSSFYVDAGDEQPERMDLLADLLTSGLHPRLDRELCARLADDITAAADLLRQARQATAVPRARRDQAQRMRTVVAKALQTELARLKKRWQADGHSEAEIHQIIPDRPRSVAVEPVAPA